MISLILLMSIECSVALSGPVDVYAKAYYLHENPVGRRYTHTTETILVTGGAVMSYADGKPVAIEWYASPHGVSPTGSQLVKTCGDVPDAVYPRVFSDGFEGGSTMGWSKTDGGK